VLPSANCSHHIPSSQRVSSGPITSPGRGACLPFTLGMKKPRAHRGRLQGHDGSDTEAARAILRCGLEPVSADIRTDLCARQTIPPGKGLPRPETGPAFLATMAHSARQRPRCPASAAAKPRKVKDYSDGARKEKLRRTAWWARHD
jgi:hypothetical protein